MRQQYSPATNEKKEEAKRMGMRNVAICYLIEKQW